MIIKPHSSKNNKIAVNSLTFDAERQPGEYLCPFLQETTSTLHKCASAFLHEGVGIMDTDISGYYLLLCTDSAMMAVPFLQSLIVSDIKWSSTQYIFTFLTSLTSLHQTIPSYETPFANV
jgi:hypothetical protein